MQPLTGGKRREILGLKEQVGARADHKGKGALPVAIEIDHHRGGALRRIEAHIVHIHLLLRQGVTHKTAEGIVADAADKPAVTAEPRHADRHVGRRAAGALQQAALSIGQEIDDRIAEYPDFSIHTTSSSKLNFIKPV
ncbi:Uncharacterised protein [Acinetobacter baumannii]|nr:Uncharacterised protein [Acinetobacter baumannii]